MHWEGARCRIAYSVLRIVGAGGGFGIFDAVLWDVYNAGRNDESAGQDLTAAERRKGLRRCAAIIFARMWKTTLRLRKVYLSHG